MLSRSEVQHRWCAGDCERCRHAEVVGGEEVQEAGGSRGAGAVEQMQRCKGGADVEIQRCRVESRC